MTISVTERRVDKTETKGKSDGNYGELNNNSIDEKNSRLTDQVLLFH